MGTTVNNSSMAGVGTQSAMTGTVSYGYSSNKTVRTYGSHNSSKKKTPNKKLNYNPREISGQLIRVKKAQNAAVVLTRAKAKVALLARQGGSGQYSQREVANALTHARSMVRCAQLKVRNLKMEEQEHKSYEKKNGAKDQQRKAEVKRRVAQKERRLESKIAAKEMQEATRKKREYNEIMQKRRMHRSQEQGKINEADMKYIKGMLEQGRDSGYSAVRSEAILNLSAHAAALAELQRLEAERRQLEHEMESEAATETAMDAGVSVDMSVLPAGDAGGAETAPVPEAVVAMSVDVAV